MTNPYYRSLTLSNNHRKASWFSVAVVGSESVGDWASPVTLQQNGNDRTLPAGKSANFFRVRLEE